MHLWQRENRCELAPSLFCPVHLHRTCTQRSGFKVECVVCLSRKIGFNGFWLCVHCSRKGQPRFLSWQPHAGYWLVAVGHSFTTSVVAKCSLVAVVIRDTCRCDVERMFQVSLLASDKPYVFVGAFDKLRKATINFVMYGRQHVKTRLPLDGFW